MDIILQMKINLAHVTETLQQQTFEIRQQLGAVFEEDKQELERCLAAIDQKLAECSVCFNDYRGCAPTSQPCASGETASG